MKKTIILMLLILTLVFAGCSGSATTTLTDKEIDALFIQRLTVPELPPYEKPAEPICTDYTDRGLLRICYVKQVDVRHKLQVLCGENHIEYNIMADGSIEDFSLQFGSGEYTARLLQNKSGNDYIEIETQTFSVTLQSDTIAYLNSIQNVNWNENMPPIKDVRKIVAPALEHASDNELLLECTDALYNYVCTHIEYDDDKTNHLGYNYLPDIEQTYSCSKGICYDYSSLLAAMLRSIGIPAKLSKGYASYNPDVYHAWNEVFIDGKWHVIDATLDASTGVYEPMFKKSAGYTKVSEY